MPIDWQPLQKLIDAHQRFVISSHVRPDADAIGSEQGLAKYLISLGKSVRIINPSPSPPNLTFLDPDNEIQIIGRDVTIESACETDVHFVVDTSAWQQLLEVGDALKQSRARKVVIDHHVSADDLGAMEFKDTSAAATGVLITEFLEFVKADLTAPQATALYCAIATDTGWFRFSNVDARTMHCAASLIEQGVRPHHVYRELYERSSLSRLKLHSVVLGRVEQSYAGKLTHSFVSLKDFRQTGAQPSDTEELVNICLTIEGTEAAFLLVEQPDGRVKASIRSRSRVDVASVAEQFGGGGHRQAAGAMLDGPIEAAQSSLIKAFAQQLSPEDSKLVAE